MDGTDGPIKDQGAAGTCTAFALSTAMDNAIRRMGKDGVVAPLHVWSRYRVPKMGPAGDQNLNKGVSVEAVWPYDPAKACRLARERYAPCEQAYDVKSNSSDPALEAEAARADAMGVFTLSSVERLHDSPGDPKEMAAIIAGGAAVWAAFNVNRRAWHLRGGDDFIDDYHMDDGSGHAVVLSGYRTVNGQKQFLVHNSWGPEWGDNGYGWISENMVRDQMIYAYKVAVAEGGGSAPPPSPTPPAGNGCPQGQVRDHVYGDCAAPCPSGSPPSAGFCLPAVPGFPLPFPGQQPAPAPPSGPPAGPPAQPGGTPPSPPPGGACPPGTAPDIFTGTCTQFCPGGMPAIGGLCLPAMR